MASPMLGYALFGIGRYVWNGATDVAVPAMTIAGVRYLPMMRYRLTPYGTQWALENEFAGLPGPRGSSSGWDGPSDDALGNWRPAGLADDGPFGARTSASISGGSRGS